MNWLREMREEKGMTQTEVAKETGGLTRTGYTNIENGKRRPSPENAKKIAAVLGFDWTRFYEDDKEVG